MEPIYLPEAVSSALSASFLGTGSAPDAKEPETRVEFGWLAEVSGDLRCLNQRRMCFVYFRLS